MRPLADDVVASLFSVDDIGCTPRIVGVAPRAANGVNPSRTIRAKRPVRRPERPDADRLRDVGRLLLGCREGAAGLAAIVNGAPHRVAGDLADVARLLRRCPEAKTDALASH
jgi:hypothetical protein